jgi:hypothetical protein
LKHNELIREFSYKHSGALLNVLPLFWAWVIFPFVLLLLVAFTFVHVATQLLTVKDLMDFLALCAASMISLILPHQIINQYNTIQVFDNGLRVRVFSFIFKWKFIEWNGVVGIESSKVVDRWRKNVWVIIVKELTFWHRLLSRIYRINSYPAIILTSDLEEREKLLDIVAMQIK